MLEISACAARQAGAQQGLGVAPRSLDRCDQFPQRGDLEAGGELVDTMLKLGGSLGGATGRASGG